MKISAILAVLSAITLTAFATENAALSIVFNKAQDFSVNGKKVPFNGPIRTVDGHSLMAFGKQGYRIPVNGLVGEQGTIVFSFALDKNMQPSKSLARSLVILRLKGREEIGFYTFLNNPTLQYRFANQKKNFYGKSEKLLPEKIYRAALSWDGDRIRCYLNGKLIQEQEQPFPVDARRIDALCIGPYKDGYYIVPPWHNDTMIGELKLYDRVLSGEEIAGFAGIQSKSVRERYGRIIAAPKRSSGQVCGNSFVSLTGLSFPEKCWELPKHSCDFSWDDRNLYLRFDTVFPANTMIKKGNTASDPESGVWGSEDFELLLRHSGNTYYFAGSVNGGKCDLLNKNSSYNPVWQYQSSLSMQIDDTQLWQGNIVIPWKALQLDAPPKELKMNFCRSFFNSFVTAACDLAGKTTGRDGYWAGNDYFYTLQFTENTPSLKIIEKGNPSYGNLDQEFELTSPVDRQVKFQIIQESEKGLIQPQNLLSKTIALKANIPQKVKVQTPLTTLQTDRLVYKLTDSAEKQIYLCQDLPVKISAEYLTFTPLFTAEKIETGIKNSILQSKYGKDAKFTLFLQNVKKEILFFAAVEKDKINVPFAKSNPAGLYTLEIRNAKNEQVSAKSFFFPGFGEWSKMQFDMTRILPPFTPMTYSGDNGRFTANVVLRDYQWKPDSILPVQITSRGEKLLASPVELCVDGKNVKGAFASTSAQKHRMELKTSVQTENCKIQSTGWLEYDGVQHNEIELTALQNISNVELKIRLPRKFAKYLHTSSCGWGGKITAKIKNGKRNFKYYPVVFLGNEEKGLCFFAESNGTWVNPKPQPMSVAADDKEAVFSVTLANQLKKGQSFRFDCGLLATPVKPLNKVHPLNTASWFYSIGMNRPGKTPTTWCSYLNGTAVLGDAFADIPNVDNDPTLKALQTEVAFAKAHQVHPFSYNPHYISHEYPEVRAFSTEWETVPRQLWNGKRKDSSYMLSLLCPASPGSDFFLWHVKKYLEKVKVDGLNFDFGIVPVCDNHHHGCHNRTPLIAYRNFYRKLAMLLLDSGAQEYVIHVHNTDSVQLPAYTFVTHLMNGEHIRQDSSTLMHNGKDILDSYPLEMFACELSSLPFGIYNAAYQSNDVLKKEFGGGKEDPELYKLRITRAFLSGMLIHDSISALNRCHYGIYDKIVRIYSGFGVPSSEFIGYWDERKAAEVLSGQDVYVSMYRHPSGKRLLAVISHIGNKRLDQDVTIRFHPEALRMNALKKATERMETEDKEYKELFQFRQESRLPFHRIPLKWQNAGIKVLDFGDNTLKLHLPAHSFAIVEMK